MNEFCIWCVGVSFIVLLSIVGFTIWMTHPRVMPITVRGLRRQPINLIGIIGFIFGFTAFVLVVSTPDKQGDVGSNVVTIFSALVTALVAWQIWMTITSREDVREMRDNTERVEAESHRLRHLIEQERHQCEGLRWHIEGRNDLASSENDFHAPLRGYQNLARALEHYVRAYQSNLMYINDTLTNMDACLTNAQHNQEAIRQFIFHEDECNRWYHTIMDVLHLLGEQSHAIRTDVERLHRRRQSLTQFNGFAAF